LLIGSEQKLDEKSDYILEIKAVSGQAKQAYQKLLMEIYILNHEILSIIIEN